MWSWLKKLVAPKGVPNVAVVPNPLGVNPTLSERAVRNKARIERLKECIACGDQRVSIREELERRERLGK